MQEAFAGLHRNWAGVRDEEAAIGYLRTAVVNHQVDQYDAWQRETIRRRSHGGPNRAGRRQRW